MPETVDISSEIAVATLVGKSLRQRLGADDMVRDDDDVVHFETTDEAPYWLQRVKVDDTYASVPLITDHLGREFEVHVVQVDGPVIP